MAEPKKDLTDGLAGADTHHGKIEELTANNPTGLKGLIKNRYATLVGFSIGFGGLLYGYPSGVLSNILTNENFGAHFPRIYADPAYKGWVVALMELAGAVGSLIAAPMADKISRRWTLIYSVLIFNLGSAFLTAAQNDSYIVAGRFISGVAIGILANVVAIYNCEIAPSEIRGTLVAIYMFFLTFGDMLAFFVTYGFHYVGGIRCAPNTPYTGAGNTFDPYHDVPPQGCTGQSTLSWRLPFGLQIIFACLFAIIVFLSPYSPRWLMMQNRTEEAMEVLVRVRQLPRDHIIVQTEFLEMKAAMIYEKEVAEEKYPGAGYARQQWEIFKEFFTHPGLFRRLWICVIYLIFNQWAGINAILYYAPTIFANLGLDQNTTALLATGIVGLVFWVGTSVAALYLDIFGRRKMLMLGSSIMTVGHVVVAGIIGKYANQFKEYPKAGYAGAAFIYIYMIGYGITAINCNVISSEIFPSQHRSQAMAMIFAVNWLCNFAVAFATPVMLEKIGFGTFIVFGASCVAIFCWAKFIIPETSNKTVEEMDLLFKDHLVSEQAARMVAINERLGLNRLEPRITDEVKVKSVTEHVEAA